MEGVVDWLRARSVAHTSPPASGGESVSMQILNLGALCSDPLVQTTPSTAMADSTYRTVCIDEQVRRWQKVWVEVGRFQIFKWVLSAEDSDKPSINQVRPPIRSNLQPSFPPLIAPLIVTVCSCLYFLPPSSAHGRDGKGTARPQRRHCPRSRRRRALAAAAL